MRENICKSFPIPYDSEYHFVGEYVYADESRSNEHTNILYNALHRPKRKMRQTFIKK